MFTVGCVGALAMISLAWAYLADRWVSRRSHQPVDLSYMVERVSIRRGGE